MQVFVPPEYDDFEEDMSPPKRVFIAGSIEQGKAELWQNTLIEKLADLDNIHVYNPRRANWDASLEQSIKNPAFKEQVDWELDHIDAASFLFFYLQPETLSPVTLLELGMVIGRGSSYWPGGIVVVCPDGFWRKGNVDIMLKRMMDEEDPSGTVYQEATLEAGIDRLRKLLKRKPYYYPEPSQDQYRT